MTARHAPGVLLRSVGRLSTLATLAVLGCGGGDGSTDTSDAQSGPAPGASAAESGRTDPTPAGGYATTAVLESGAVEGTVRFVGRVPDAQIVVASEDADTCGQDHAVELIRTDQEGGLSDVVVALREITEGTGFAPETAPQIDQRGCRFEPHVVLAPVGGPVRITNSDPVSHNIHTLTFENRPVNKTQPSGPPAVELSFPFPDRVKVRCDIHPWMSAWIIVMEHPYHTITDAGGRFRLEGIPPGRYTLEAWHESLGTVEGDVEVLIGEATSLELEMTGN